MSVKWWGQASAVTLTPRRLPSRTSSTERAVEMCWMCSRPRVISASRMSRATMMSSAASGMPARPSRIDSKPSFMTPPTVSSGTWQCCMITRSNILEYSRARRIRAAEATGAAVVGERHGTTGHKLAKTRQFLALAALAHRAHGIDIGLASALALEHDKLGRGLAVDGGNRVGHAGHRGHSARQGGRGTRGDGFILLVAGLAQVDVNVDQAGADDQSAGVDDNLGLFVACTGRQDVAPADPEIAELVAFLAGVDDPAPRNLDGWQGEFAHGCWLSDDRGTCGVRKVA